MLVDTIAWLHFITYKVNADYAHRIDTDVIWADAKTSNGCLLIMATYLFVLFQVNLLCFRSPFLLLHKETDIQLFVR